MLMTSDTEMAEDLRRRRGDEAKHATSTHDITSYSFSWQVSR
jgi:hypothetical protein